MEGWMIWIALGIICMIIEIFTPGFLFMSFGIGAIVTGILSIFINNVNIQFLLFILVTILLFLNLRKFSKKLINSKSEDTNIFALKGKTGLVTRKIPAEGRGYVKIGGEEWSAISGDRSSIDEGEKISVLSIEGNKLIVSKTTVKEDK